MSLGLALAVWGVGFAIYGWQVHGRRTDERADYPPLVWTDPAAKVAKGDHFRVEGRVLSEQGLVHRTKGHDDHWLLPLVAPTWSHGQAARLVFQVKDPEDLPGYSRAAFTLESPVLVRVGDGVPVPAARAFAQAGVPLDSATHLLFVVPSEGGKVLPQPKGQLPFILGVCGALGALILVVGALSAWIVHRRG